MNNNINNFRPPLVRRLSEIDPPDQKKQRRFSEADSNDHLPSQLASLPRNSSSQQSNALQANMFSFIQPTPLSIQPSISSFSTPNEQQSMALFELDGSPSGGLPSNYPDPWSQQTTPLSTQPSISSFFAPNEQQLRDLLELGDSPSGGLPSIYPDPWSQQTTPLSTQPSISLFSIPNEQQLMTLLELDGSLSSELPSTDEVEGDLAYLEGYSNPAVSLQNNIDKYKVGSAVEVLSSKQEEIREYFSGEMKNMEAAKAKEDEKLRKELEVLNKLEGEIITLIETENSFLKFSNEVKGLIKSKEFKDNYYVSKYIDNPSAFKRRYSLKFNQFLYRICKANEESKRSEKISLNKLSQVFNINLTTFNKLKEAGKSEK